ncbi:coiled-coil domain-containing protein 25 isoform X2 [Pyrgilauda ruficollis]|uniref:coiled-coil domain-containing protein 25 isoform X2 n=1 Tax=Pyrgilauda ruficollis TaxID=221976 RepID=UPI001B86AF18|nr:coiled-coil domain-containing protein 25 isoform X2 [Pyrgilauda ruficollis]
MGKILGKLAKPLGKVGKPWEKYPWEKWEYLGKIGKNLEKSMGKSCEKRENLGKNGKSLGKIGKNIGKSGQTLGKVGKRWEKWAILGRSGQSWPMGWRGAEVGVAAPRQGQSVDDIPKEVLSDCAHLVKANSIQGCKLSSVTALSPILV